MTYQYPILSKKSSIISTLLGGQGWLQHIVDTIKSNKGRIFKHVVVDKYLDLLDGVTGGSVIKALLKPYLNNIAFQHDYQTQKTMRLAKQEAQKKHAQSKAAEQKKLLSDFRVQKQKQTGKKPHVRRGIDASLQYMADVNKKIEDEKKKKQEQIKKQAQLNIQMQKIKKKQQELQQKKINEQGYAKAQELLGKMKQNRKTV